jgi:hypothetical protein
MEITSRIFTRDGSTEAAGTSWVEGLDGRALFGTSRRHDIFPEKLNQIP